MGAYNILNVEVNCLNCNKKYSGRIQFKYGNTWQIEYKIGDKISWGGNEIGAPNRQKVKVYGVLENDVCPHCGQANNLYEVDIFIENDVITKIQPMESIEDYFDDDEGNFRILG